MNSTFNRSQYTNYGGEYRPQVFTRPQAHNQSMLDTTSSRYMHFTTPQTQNFSMVMEHHAVPGASYIGLDRTREFHELARPKQCLSEVPSFSRTPDQHNETLLRDVGSYNPNNALLMNPLIRELYPLKESKVFISPTINFIAHNETVLNAHKEFHRLRTDQTLGQSNPNMGPNTNQNPGQNLTTPQFGLPPSNPNPPPNPAGAPQNPPIVTGGQPPMGGQQPAPPLR